MKNSCILIIPELHEKNSRNVQKEYVAGITVVFRTWQKSKNSYSLLFHDSSRLFPHLSQLKLP